VIFSARLQAGTITTLIGGNGAGKSDAVARHLRHQPLVLRPIVFKARPSSAAAWQRLKRGIGFVPQGRLQSFPRCRWPRT